MAAEEMPPTGDRIGRKWWDDGSGEGVSSRPAWLAYLGLVSLLALIGLATLVNWAYLWIVH